MTGKFIYKKKSSTSIWPVLAFAVIAVMCVYFQYGIAIGRLRLLSYPNSAIVTALITVGWGVYYFFERKKEKVSDKNPDYIEFDGEGFRISTSKGEFAVAYSDVTAIKHEAEKDDEYASVEITTKENKSFEWQEDGFASPAEFKEFSNILNTNCNHLSFPAV